MISHRERLLSLVGALGLPVAFGLLLLSTSVAQETRPPGRDLALFDVAAASAVAPAPPRPKLDRRIEPIPVVLSEAPTKAPLPPEVVSLLTTAAEQPGACDLTAPVQAALQGAPGVADAIATLPRDARSVANAIMVWNEGWFPSDGTDAVGLAAIRETIVATVDAATPECRTASQGGPRFLTLGDAEATVVALGSDQWRWQDLVDTATTQPPRPVAPQSSSRPVSAATTRPSPLFPYLYRAACVRQLFPHVIECGVFKQGEFDVEI